MRKVWQLKPTAGDGAAIFKDWPPAIGQLLFNRGLKNPEEADYFLNPAYKHLHDPFLFRDMAKAVTRIEQAIKNGQKIVVHGDYDADGVCGAAILVSTLETLGALVEVFLPHREMDGYGLNKDTVELLVADGVGLIITADCGVSNLQEIKLAKERRVEVIVTDHHTIPKELPPAWAMLHPKISGETYPDQTLCGAGVAFKLAQALIKKLGGAAEKKIDWLTFEKKLLELVAVASVADMVPLLGETRVLVKFGLMVLNKAPRPGLKKLLELAGLKNITTEQIGWKIAPRLNAAGRMNHANSAYELLISLDESAAANLAADLEKNNLHRQKSTEAMMREAKQLVTDQGLATRPVIAVYKDDWSAGLVGLIASRLKEAYGKPALVFSRDGEKMVGSGRSIEGWNMIAALQELPHFFEKFGGHPQACGFSLKSPDLFVPFYEAIDRLAREQCGGAAARVMDIEAEQPLEEINWNFYQYLKSLEPFGKDNPVPRFLAKGLTVVNCQVMGATKRHLRLFLEDETGKIHKTVGFGLADWQAQLQPNSKIDLVYELSENEWNGQKELQIKIVDLRLCA